MDRKEFFEKTMKLGICSCGLLVMNQTGLSAITGIGSDEAFRCGDEGEIDR